jgi:hypothetical protein
MLRSRLFLLAVLALAFLPRPGWSAGDTRTLDQLTARAKALEKRSYGPEIPAMEILELESEFISLLRQDPENREVAAGLVSFYGRWLWTLKAPAPALLDLVRTSRDPGGLARIFVERFGEGPYPIQAQIALAAVAARPSDPVLWDLAAKVSPDVAWKISFQEEAFRVALSAPSASSGAAATSALAARWLASWQGGTLSLEEKDGQWIVQEVSSWIT